MSILSSMIKNIEKYYAHTDENEKEILEIHIDRTEKYFKKIYEKQGIEIVLRRWMDQVIGKDINEEVKTLLIEMWMSVATFHDAGKINPKFQKDKMKNKKIQESKLEELSIDGSNHSRLSSIIYILYYSRKIKNIEKVYRAKIYYIMLLNAYIIDRHHSDLNSFVDFISEEKGIYSKVYHDLLEKMGKENDVFLLQDEKIGKRFCNIKQNYVNIEKISELWNQKENEWNYFYSRLLYSCLVASDYYATSEFYAKVEIKDVSEKIPIDDFIAEYEKTKLYQRIQEYKQNTYPMDKEKLDKIENINILRNEIFVEVDKNILEQDKTSVFYLEAPTGSGKSNMAMNLSFQLAKKYGLSKLYYVYPFNTLVEQNIEIIENIFGKKQDLMNKIVTINSLTPIKMKNNKNIIGINPKEETEINCYEKSLLDRQFLNYPFILTTHVSLFYTIFSDRKEDIFGFYQLKDSVIVLDEIQSYPFEKWKFMIEMLYTFSEFLNVKIIIMSATLPHLDYLLDYKDPISQKLVKDSRRYFTHPCFKDRVNIMYDILEEQNTKGKAEWRESWKENLYDHMKQYIGKKKILVEFIVKKSAEEFYFYLKENETNVYLMSGSDNCIERKRILNEIKEKENTILIATQVVEAGVDIDMDIGYKDISKLDSEEQFLGRIGRSRFGEGKAYFFDLDNAKSIYKKDARISNESVTLKCMDKPSRWLKNKEYEEYYRFIMDIQKSNYNQENKEFNDYISKLNFPEISIKMKLIEEDEGKISVYFAREIEDDTGEILFGEDIWELYIELLGNQDMMYAEKIVKLSEVRAKMNYFIYELSNYDLSQMRGISFHQKIGNLYYIEDGECYFEDNKLDRRKFESNQMIF